ncbi:MAG TPA: hypothetical protein QGH10_07285 [Armatimonadota bacterium]|nr:hypothetical protein [Armatimonadota bacterium]
MAVIAFVLCLASLCVNVPTRVLHVENVPFDHLLDVIQEGNIPTYFSTVILALAALLLWVVAAGVGSDDPRGARPWKALSLIFLYLSVDEASQLHELSRRIPKHWLPDWGILHWPWVIIGTVGVIALILGFCRFLKQLQKDTRVGIIVAGAIFIGGALGLELVGASLISSDGPQLALVIEETVEEFMEMTGVILFINALLLHITRHLPPIQLRVLPTDPVGETEE